MKNKYQRMTKEEQKRLRADYLKTDIGKNRISRLNRLLVIGVLGIILSTFLVINNYIAAKNIWEYVSGSILFIISLIFIFQSMKIRDIEYNKYALKIKN